jgi:starch synthase
MAFTLYLFKAGSPLLKVLSVASEIFPFVKTGGLADVTGALPKALRAQGVDTLTLVPGYPALLERVRRGEPLLRFHALLGESGVVWAYRNDIANMLVLDIPELYDRSGGPYLDQNGEDHHDNWKRFAALSLAAARIAEGCLPEWKPDIVHTHDWQTALTSVYMRHLGCETPVVLTIHNIAFQGQFSAQLMPYLHLPDSEYSIDRLEYYEGISYLKGGIVTSDMITTVSPTYAREILTPEFGMGMQDILRLKGTRLRGILNGIDDDVWNPATDTHIPTRFDVRRLGDKHRNRVRLAASFGLHQDDGPIFAAVTRLSWQKGIDMLLEVADDIIHQGGKLIVCGQGDHWMERALIAKASENPGRMAVHIGYSEDIAHFIHAGADAMIQPSRFEHSSHRFTDRWSFGDDHRCQ